MVPPMAIGSTIRIVQMIAAEYDLYGLHMSEATHVEEATHACNNRLIKIKYGRPTYISFHFQKQMNV